MEDEPLRLRDVLRTGGRLLGIQSAVETGTIFKRWRHIVGDQVAAHARPSSLREGVLRVRADSPVWATEITYLAPEIGRRANEEVGGVVVKEVRVWWAPAETETHSPSIEREGSPERAAAPPPRVRPDDPAGALERAHRAWRRRGGRAARSSPAKEAR